MFNFQHLSNPILSKLYSCEDFSKLSINIDESNITFEELLSDFYVELDCIVTQVIHLEYTAQGKNSFITHIDHEYIFYNEEEYENRSNNHKQKGTARPRFKTFKIDKSTIPFYLENGDFFLYIMLSFYFHQNELLVEYFENVIGEEKQI